MSPQESHHDSPSQALISDSWDNRDPNPSKNSANEDSIENTETQTIEDFSDEAQPEPQKSTGATISQEPQSVVNSNGVVIPYTRQILCPIETWTQNSIPTQTLNDLFDNTSPESTTPSKPSTSDEPNTNSRTSETPSSTETLGAKPPSETDQETTPIKPVSTHAKKAAEKNRQRQTNSEETTTTPANKSSSAGTRLKLKPEHTGSDSAPEKTETEEKTENNKTVTKTPTGNELLEQDCPECGSDVIAEGSDQFCSDCGLLIADQQIDPGPEWRSFNHSQKTSRSRVGGPVKNNIHDKGLSTVIGSGNKDANGKPLSPRMRQKMKRLRKWDSRFKVKNTKERNLRQAFGEIQRISSEMDIPEYVEETACTVYRRALDEELLPGRSIEAMASASVYIAMRQASIPKTLEHMMLYCRVSESRVTGAYSYLGRELGIEIQPPEVLEYLSRVSSELDVSKETERKAEELLQTSVEKNLHSGKAPSGMAAASVYASTMITRCDRVTQEDACDAGDVCELTIRTRHRELLEAYGVDYEEISPPSQAEVKENREDIGVTEDSGSTDQDLSKCSAD